MKPPGDWPTGQDLYVRLEVSADASHDEIVRAYRRLALSVHPDVHPQEPDATLRFQGITEAYEVLADDARRAAYDRTRQHRDPQQRSVSSPGRPDPRQRRSQPSAPPSTAEPVWLDSSPLDARRPPPPRAPTLWAGPVRVHLSPDSAARTAGGDAVTGRSTSVFGAIAKVLWGWPW